MRALYANEKNMAASLHLLDSYIATAPGEPYRLFPFGSFVKGGQRRDITPELARRFRLPHFKPPVKLGSHEDTTPAGGHIVGLEVREDGLYAIPDLTERGAQALKDGAYRYHSPEVIWEGSGYENPVTGELIEGPLIVGDALLHTPHLGESTALYSVETMEVNKEMADNEQNVFERFMAWVESRKPAEQPAPVVPADELTAAITQRDELKAKLEALEAQQQHAARVEKFAADLATTKAEAKPEILASMTDEQAAWVVTQFKALSAQINESALLGEKGSEGDGLPSDPKAALDAAARAIMAEKKVDYSAALRLVDPALIAAAYAR